MGYAVLHLEKTSGTDAGMSAHIERTISPKNADPLRTHLNKELVQFPEEVNNRTLAIQHRIENAGIMRKISKGQVRAIRILLTGSPDKMKEIEKKGQLDNWCNDNLEWLKNTYGKENIVSAVLHLDESTAHLHATLVPIVTGERRKIKAEKEKQTEKRKYKKKSTDNVRLCADDLMSRTKLKEYQNSYAEAMAKYGLQRGIDGSEAKHISTSQYYRELLGQTDGVKENLDNLIQQQEQATQELSKARSEIKTQKLKNTAVNVATSAMEGIGSIFDSSKLKTQEQEIGKLKTENTNLRIEIRQLNDRICNLKTEYTKTTEKLREEVRKIYTVFPHIRDLFNIEKLCKAVGFSDEFTKKILTMIPVEFRGKLYSIQHLRKFETDHSIVKIDKDNSEPNRLALFIDSLEVKEWFKNKYLEFQKDLWINTKQKQDNSRNINL